MASACVRPSALSRARSRSLSLANLFEKAEFLWMSDAKIFAQMDDGLKYLAAEVDAALEDLQMEKK